MIPFPNGIDPQKFNIYTVKTHSATIPPNGGECSDQCQEIGLIIGGQFLLKQKQQVPI